MVEEKQMIKGWKESSLEKLVFKMQSGGTPKSDNPDYYNGTIPFVAIDDLTSANKYLVQTKKHLTKEGLINSAAWLVPKNSLMYSIYATLGVPRINKISAATNQAIINLIPNGEKMDLEYLFYMLLYKRYSILAHSAHTTQSNLNAKKVKELSFYFPHLITEQQKIAEVLTKVDSAITQTEQLITKYKRIKTGIMQDLLTKGIDKNGNIRSEKTHKFKDSPLGRIPVEWDCDKLSKGIEHISDYRGKTPPYQDNGIPVISAETVSKGKLKPFVKFVSEFTYSIWLTREIPQGGDVIFTMEAPVGEIALFPKGKRHLLTRRVIAFHTKKYKLINDFLYYQLLIFQESGIWNPKIIGSTVPRILKPDVLSQYIPYPDTEEQESILNVIHNQETTIDVEKLKLNKLKALKKGLMQDLLSGKKRVTSLLKNKSL